MGGLRVAVVGAGLGGLCLAQGLRRVGVEVEVYERDAGPGARPQGYRLHLDARAGLALQQCLPPALFALFQATCGRPSRQFSVLSDQLRVLHEARGEEGVDRYAPATLSTSVHRQTLREVLGAGLDDRIHYGRELRGFAADASGVRLRFADGGSTDADLLVGADGVGSVTRRALLPHARVVDTGGRCLYGSTPLNDEARALLPPALHQGFTAFVGGRTGMAAGLVRLRQQPEQAAARIAPEARLSPVADYLMWAVTAQRARFRVSDAELSAAGPATLHALAAGAIRGWHPDLRRLVELAEVDRTFLAVIRSAEPVPAWEPGPVTLLGDAIHAMSPARGSGANTALQDAATLCRELTAHPGEPVLAVGAYEAAMREYGFAAVEASRRAEAEGGARGAGRLAFWLYRRLARG
ncbi:FAD-dependent oxidoreductase [Streptacidiphilus rugosus]|uniref:FAD-dependent oxidoreductase n=1 Tax=Streptacidiphilus rugosus TaxID=405783 RepID=UPI0006892EC0|nr:FAD-dependent monooxygenase [Streptacidiphilus rugosus]